MKSTLFPTQRSPVFCLIFIFSTILLPLSCFHKSKENAERATEALIPRATPPDQGAAITSKEEVVTWVSKAQHCLATSNWECARNYAQQLSTLEDPVVRAFGSWLLGLDCLQLGQWETGYRYLGLAVRDNPKRVAFHKWFALSAFAVKQWSISQRHADWALRQPETAQDRELYVLLKLQDTMKEGAPIPSNVDFLDELREPSGQESPELSVLWKRVIDRTLQLICGDPAFSSKGFCHTAQ